MSAIAETVFRKIREFYLGYLERILRAAAGRIDIVLTGDDFGAQNGGYIFCTSHNIQADTPVENIITLMEAYLQYGKM